jgi:hypothetical protein
VVFVKSLYWNSPEETEEDYESFRQDSRFPDRDSNRALSEHKSAALPFEPTCSAQPSSSELVVEFKPVILSI